MTVEEQQRVDRAIEGGVTYLRESQLPSGTWIVGKWTNFRGSGALPVYYPAGFAALGGLTLLECGIPSHDRAVQRAARYVRQFIPRSFRIYEVSVAVLFLDRLGEAKDRPLIRSLALRLAAAQTTLGGWGYICPVLTSAQEKKLLGILRKKKLRDVPSNVVPPSVRKGSEQADNSNTQFALLALWTARRHDLPLDWTLAFAEQRFRLSQSRTGWGYRWWLDKERCHGSMTCVGLLSLGVGRGAVLGEPTIKDGGTTARSSDEGFERGLRALAEYMDDPSDFQGVGATEELGPKRAVNLYFLWSVERVGVLCGLNTIGGRDWYRWGLDLLLPTQRKDGSWVGRASAGYAAADTSFALLFLKRSDLLPDLRRELAKRVKIVDPGPIQKGVVAKQKGKTPSFPKGLETSPGEKTPAAEQPLEAALGDVKADTATKHALRVRGPEPFRILGVRGGDDRLSVAHDALRKDVHELTLTLRPARAGTFTRTLILRTDLPGRAEIAVIVRARAAP